MSLMDSKVTLEALLENSTTSHNAFRSSPLPISDFMAALSDPGGFSKAAEKQNETMKGLGIEQTDAKAETKKKKEEETKRGIIKSYKRYDFFLYQFEKKKK